MFNNTEKVVKCGQCDKYFVHTKELPKCPFCQTEYCGVEEKEITKKETTKVIFKDIKKKNETTERTQKESFKIWNNS